MARNTVTGGAKKTKKPTKGGRAPKPVGGRAVPRESRLAMVRRLVDTLSNALDTNMTKTGVAELIRLLALEKELGGDQETVREIKVTWIEPIATESSI